MSGTTYGWAGTDSPICEAVRRFSSDCLQTYEVDRRRITEDANLELDALSGAYARRQLYELIQNGADELIGVRGKVAIVLTDGALYCANQAADGREVTEAGVEALLSSHNSPKRGVEIGRFGLGFKSVLAVSDTPAIVSKSGSFGFDSARNLALVRAIAPDTDRAATLRLAEPVDPYDAAEQDPVLAELMEWAKTVVVVPRDRGDSSWLSDGMRDFPAQFLLFSSHVSRLELDDRTRGGFLRRIELEPGKDGTWHLNEEGHDAGRTTWRLFGAVHQLSAAARADNDRHADRSVVPLNWAVPVSRPMPGRLWAFFPTIQETTLSGIVNAPWKLNNDRASLAEPSAYNQELLLRTVDLVVDNLSAVNRADDPGYVLELLPGRGREIRGWADRILSDEVYEAASRVASLPDQRGALRPPGTLRVNPSQVSHEAAEVWSERPSRPVNWVHPSAVRGTTRRSRVDKLLESANVPAATAREWLEVLVPKANRVRGSIAAVTVAAELAHSEADQDMRQARIVLTADDRLLPARKDLVYLPSSVDVDVDVPVVAAELVSDTEALDALRRLGLLEVSAATVLDALLDRMERDPQAAREHLWAQAWDLAKRVTTEDLEAIVIDQHGLRADEVWVKSTGGRLIPLATAVLPGDLLRIEDFKASHRDLLVDIDHHRRELDLFRRLGAADRPRGAGGSLDEPWLKRYVEDAINQAVADADRHGAHAKAADFEIVPGGRWAGPAGTLDGLLPDTAAKFARELLTVNQEFEPWQLRATKGHQVVSELEHPILWRVRRFGQLPSTKGIRPIEECVTNQLRELQAVLPVVDLPRAACRALGLPDTVRELDDHRVQVALTEAEGLTRPEELGAVYAALTVVHPRPPERIRAVVRDTAMWVAPTEACVAVTEKDARVLRLTGTPYVRVDDEESSEHLASVWWLKRVGEVVSSRLNVVPDGEREPVADAFPLLRLILGPVVEGIDFLACREIQREMYTERGSISETLDFDLRDGIAHHLSDMGDAARLRRLAEHLGHPLDPDAVKAICENAQAAELQAMISQVRAAPTDAARLTLLFDIDVLRARIPTELIDAVEETDGELDHLQTAELALNVFGIETLKVYREALTQLGLSPPAQWTGRRPAVKFVTEELGFPRTYAGFADIKLEQTLEVPGPSPLPDLHEFQRRAAYAILELVHERHDPRGMLKLPTGAGKTRVTVQALIKWMTDEQVRAPVLWIAQTEELCEQAVQSWAEVWRAVGPKNRSLLISRLWGGHSAEPRENEDDQVLVATVDKIDARCIDNPEYDWLRRPACLVIDEAHGATTPSYTRLLRWTGIQDATEHAPLIGLSATPYRGSERETERLAGRFGMRRLDEGVFDDEVSIDLLQREGVLAQVDHRILEGSQDVPLTSAERDHIKTLKELPSSVLNKIGGDIDRTYRLVESVMTLPDDWPVLIFAASVAHAGTVAALLARRGRSAAAVSGSTPTSVRRHLVAEFRKNRLATLTNYGVLTQGFDAPSIRALYIARPTYSANLYQQMIGRGLRGPANNGKEVCTVFDVADNVTAYGLDLAFREFEHVWKSWQENSE